jgi:DNA-binding response OmpR family regulator
MSRGNARILMIDHERGVVRAVRRELVANGYDVFTTFKSEKALEVVARYRPDLVLLDLDLPGMSGLEVCALIRAQSNLPPIIVISAGEKESARLQALDLGADDSISKPLHMPELLARIRVALRHRASAWRYGMPLRCRWERRPGSRSARCGWTLSVGASGCESRRSGSLRPNMLCSKCSLPLAASF